MAQTEFSNVGSGQSIVWAIKALRLRFSGDCTSIGDVIGCRTNRRLADHFQRRVSVYPRLPVEGDRKHTLEAPCRSLVFGIRNLFPSSPVTWGRQLHLGTCDILRGGGSNGLGGIFSKPQCWRFRMDSIEWGCHATSGRLGMETMAIQFAIADRHARGNQHDHDGYYSPDD